MVSRADVQEESLAKGTALSAPGLVEEAWNQGGEQFKLAARLDGLVPMTVYPDGSIGPMGSVADSGAQRPVDRSYDPGALSSLKPDIVRTASVSEANLALPGRLRFTTDTTAAAGYYDSSSHPSFAFLAKRNFAA